MEYTKECKCCGHTFTGHGKTEKEAADDAHKKMNVWCGKNYDKSLEEARKPLTQ
jgi:hypothetical protein